MKAFIYLSQCSASTLVICGIYILKFTFEEKNKSHRKHSQGFLCNQRPGSLKNYGSSAPCSRPQSHQTKMETVLEDQRGSFDVSGPKGRLLEMMPSPQVGLGAPPSTAGAAAPRPPISSICWKRESTFSTLTQKLGLGVSPPPPAFAGSKETIFSTTGGLAQHYVQHLLCPPRRPLSALGKPTGCSLDFTCK